MMNKTILTSNSCCTAPIEQKPIDSRNGVRKKGDFKSTEVASKMKNKVPNGVTVLSAFMAVLPTVCCIGPMAAIILSVFGLSGVAVSATLQPYQTPFTILTFVFLGASFYLTYRPQKKSCEEGKVCAIPRFQKVQRITLWVVTIIAIIFTSFPYLLPYLPVEWFY